MRLLVTGVTGFAGRNLAAHAGARGDQVVGLARRPHPGDELEPLLAGYHPADLADPAAVRDAVAAARPDAVVHLAAAASVAASWRDPEPYLAGNPLAAHALLEAVREHAPEATVLLAGSGEVYGAVPPGRLPVREQEPPRPQSPYAVGKLSAELVARLAADAHGTRVVLTRAFNHIGPGQSDAYVVASFARQIAEAERRAAAPGESFEIRTGRTDVRRDFTDVRDVARAYRLLLDLDPADVPDGPVNVCSGRAVSIAEVLAGLAAHARVEVRPRTDPERVRPHELEEMRGANERLAGLTGWAPELPLERTLADTLDWWRGRLAEAG